MSSIVLPAPRGARASVEIPGDKSITHRALMCAAIADGDSSIVHANRGADARATVAALRALGVDIDDDGAAIRVRGARTFADPPGVLDCGNSGSTMRMLAGLLAGRADATLDGDDSLRRRPMRRVVAPLRKMNADIAMSVSGTAPLTIRRQAAPLQGARIAMDVASAQVKSAILFAGLHASGETSVVEFKQTRDHTERMLSEMGASITADRAFVTIRASRLRALAEYIVPGDLSAAFFFIAAASVVPGSELILRDIGVNPTRVAALDAIARMGASVRRNDQRIRGGEPVADIVVTAAPALVPALVRAEDIPNLIDEIPALCAVAAFAAGDFTIRDAAELRTKESDRIATTVELLRSFGVAVDELPDGIVVHGGHRLTPPTRVPTRGDHRIGMSAAILAAGAAVPIEIEDADCIATSFPGFEQAWRTAFAASM